MFEMAQERCLKWHWRDVWNGTGEMFEMALERCLKWHWRDVWNGTGEMVVCWAGRVTSAANVLWMKEMTISIDGVMQSWDISGAGLRSKPVFFVAVVSWPWWRYAESAGETDEKNQTICIQIRMIYSFRLLPRMKGCRWMTYHLTVHTIITPMSKKTIKLTTMYLTRY